MAKNAVKKAKSKPDKPPLFVDAVTIDGKVIKVAEDNLDYCVKLKQAGRTIHDPHDLLKGHRHKKFLFDK
ncbi:MAG: hypothetical protein JKY75_05425 [Erythrobacter sp.]|jgi:hypothetical protein|nr:hypothetical protein [Erythrobacter sp.]